MSVDNHLTGLVQDWTPGQVSKEAVVEPRAADLLASVLGTLAPGQESDSSSPPMWHGCYFADQTTMMGLGADGHPLEGSHYPPIPNRRRMFVGGRLDVMEPLRFGLAASLTGEVVRQDIKHGRTGEMLFVTVRQTLEQAGQVCAVEEQNIMYRAGAPTKSAARDEPAGLSPGDAPWQAAPVFGPTQLFTFSALTANAHRIHYDLDYARDVEGYPGLVVHGPLLVLSMLELVRTNAPDRTVRALSYRLQKPVTLGDELRADGRPFGASVELVLRSSRHDVVATAQLELD